MEDELVANVGIHDIHVAEKTNKARTVGLVSNGHVQKATAVKDRGTDTGPNFFGCIGPKPAR